MDSETFYERFEAGSLGDDTDFFEWAGSTNYPSIFCRRFTVWNRRFEGIDDSH